MKKLKLHTPIYESFSLREADIGDLLDIDNKNFKVQIIDNKSEFILKFGKSVSKLYDNDLRDLKELVDIFLQQENSEQDVKLSGDLSKIDILDNEIFIYDKNGEFISVGDWGSNYAVTFIKKLKKIFSEV